jgi:hypothetical protein
MIVEIFAFFVLLAGIAIFGTLAWLLTLHLIGFERRELAMWTDRVRERGIPRIRVEPRSAAAPMPAAPTGVVADRVDRLLARLDDEQNR